MVILRALFCLTLFVAPMLLWVRAQRNRDSALILILPLFGAVPAVLGAWFVFAPIEHGLDASGHPGWKDLAVPAAGSGLIVLFAVLASLTSAHPIAMLRRLFTRQALAAMSLWMVAGAIWGGLWRLSAWAFAAIGLA